MPVLPADFTATVTWGDNMTSGGHVGGPDGGPFTITTQHSYADEGTYTFTVSVVDVGGATAQACLAAR